MQNQKEDLHIFKPIERVNYYTIHLTISDLTTTDTKEIYDLAKHYDLDVDWDTNSKTNEDLAILYGNKVGPTNEFVNYFGNLRGGFISQEVEIAYEEDRIDHLLMLRI